MKNKPTLKDAFRNFHIRVIDILLVFVVGLGFLIRAIDETQGAAYFFYIFLTLFFVGVARSLNKSREEKEINSLKKERANQKT